MRYIAMASEDRGTVIELTESDVPGAHLSEPFASHTVPELRWWLLCRDIAVPTSWKKQKLSQGNLSAGCCRC